MHGNCSLEVSKRKPIGSVISCMKYYQWFGLQGSSFSFVQNIIPSNTRKPRMTLYFVHSIFQATNPVSQLTKRYTYIYIYEKNQDEFSTLASNIYQRYVYIILSMIRKKNINLFLYQFHILGINIYFHPTTKK